MNLLSVPLMFSPCKTKEKSLSPLCKDPDDRPGACTFCYYFTHRRRESGEIRFPAPNPGCRLETVSASCATTTDLHGPGGPVGRDGRCVRVAALRLNVALRSY